MMRTPHPHSFVSLGSSTGSPYYNSTTTARVPHDNEEAAHARVGHDVHVVLLERRAVESEEAVPQHGVEVVDLVVVW
jgi:hypothetical protein